MKIQRFKNDKGEYHRLDGPAYININYAEWWINGRLHRIDGPAIVFPIGIKRWYLNGIEYTENDHYYNVFRMEHNLSENIKDWPKDKQMLFKLTWS